MDSNREFRNKAQALGAKFILGHKVTKIEQDDNGVVVEVEDIGTIKSKYLTGCDGPNSITRKALNIARRGQGGISCAAL